MKPKQMPWIAVALLAPLVYSGPTSAQFDQLKKLGRAALHQQEESKQIAYFKIKGPLAETPVNMPPLFGGDAPLSLKGLLERFKEARLDKNVVAVLLDLQDAALGLGQLEELHEALRKFAAVDKPVFVHADSLTTVTYAAATGASHISVVPTGDVWLLGLYGETPYLRGALDKIGCTPDIETCGDFKTAGEPLMRKEPSEPSKQMTKWLLDGLYVGLVDRIAKGRGMSPEKVTSLIDDGPYSAEEALAAGLIDSVKHRQDFIADLKKRYGEGIEFVADYGKSDELDMPQDPFAMFSFLMKLLNPSPKVYTEPSVAIVYIDGTIQTGSAEVSPFGGGSGAYSTTIRKGLDRAASDDSVKAVVMRVDSPGGSALASEIILDAARRVAAKKPLVVSMGNVAGSGGYYVTCAAETIFADSGTITASIGVLGGKIVTTGMWDKLGVNWNAVQRGKMAGILRTAAPFSDPERAKIRHYMDTVYGIFKKHVTDARGAKLKKPIDDIAGGRVFTGAQALDIGLIDKIGGLEDAIKFAAQRAGLGEYEIRVIPEPPGLFDLFKHKGDEDGYADVTVAPRPTFMQVPPFDTMTSTLLRVDPLRVQAMVRSLQRIDLLLAESVITMMPDELLIR
jgi:protease-4